MKKLAFVALGLALAACSSSEDSASTDSSAAAVKRGPTDEVKNTTPTTSDEAPPTPADPSYEPPPETCATMRAKAPRSELTWTWTGSMIGSAPAPWVDVEIHLTRRELHGDELSSLKDGTREFKFTLALSSVKNGPLYASFGGHPMDEQVMEFSGRLMANKDYENPFLGLLPGNETFTGGYTCHDGEWTGGGSSALDLAYQEISIAKIENGFAEGSFIRKTASMEVIATGTFRGPVTVDTDVDDPTLSATGKKTGFHPNKALCCKPE